MGQSISSTHLRQNINSILTQVEDNPDKLFIVESHKKPRAILISYERYKKLKKNKRGNERSLWDKVKNNIAAEGVKINSTKLIRERRDEE